MFPVYYTGIRSGDIITSSPGSKQNNGSILHISFEKSFYPPSKSAVLSLNKNEFINLIEFVRAASPYFNNSSDADIEKWLKENAIEYDDLYISDKNNKQAPSYSPPDIRIEKLGGNIFADIEYPPDYFPLLDLYNSIPSKKIGTHARRHTLVFRPNIWTLSLQTEVKKLYKGPAFNMHSLNYIYTENPDYIIKFKTGQELGVLIEKRTIPIKLDELFPLIIKKLDIDMETINIIVNEIKYFSPSIHKSLIQKIIRRRVGKVVCHSGKYDAKLILLISFSMLLTHPGAFVPDLQIYVSGLESATKRLAVSINEDSYVKNSHDLVSLYIAAYLAKPRNWFPSIDIIERWMNLAIESYFSTIIYKYNLKKDIKSKSKYEVTDSYDLCYLLLNEIKSFETDIQMLEQIAVNNGDFFNSITEKAIEGTSPIEGTIPIVSAIDHHTHTDIFYLIDPTYLDVRKFSRNCSFKLMVKELWDKISSINPRHNQQINKEDPFVRAITMAQWRWHRMHILEKKYNRKITEETIQINDILRDDGHLAGIIGSHEIKVGSKTLLVSVDPTDISNRIMLTRPTRDLKDYSVTPEQRQDSILKFDKKLRNGINVKIPKGISWLFKDKNQASIRLSVNNIFMINGIEWNILKETPITLHIHPPTVTETPFNHLDIAIETKGIGIETLNIENIYKDDYIMRRVLNYLRGISSKIIMPAISRDGSSIGNPIDIEVFDFLIKLSVKLPGVIEILNPKEFIVKNNIIMNMLARGIREKLSSKEPIKQVWKTINKPRELFSHQKEAKDEIIARMKFFDVHIIDMPIGSGKTSIICDLLRTLIDEEVAPSYVVYTLPPSSYDNIYREFNLYGYETYHIDPRKNKILEKLSPGIIYFIFHDHLRYPTVYDILRKIDTEMFFIVDEFHLTLNDNTQRTSRALELARLSSMTIAMSGTPIKDNRMDLLIPWLKMTVNFEVDDHNFWVAISAMIRRKVELNITVNYLEDEALMTRNEEQTYFSLLEKNEFKSAINIAYVACARRMIELTKERQKVFMVARNMSMAEQLKDMLIETGIKENEIYTLSKNRSITYTPHMIHNINLRVIITTPYHSTGYTLTAMDTLITSVYFSNEATRSQLIGRIARIGQPKKEIDVITVHTGILTNILQRYNEARNMSLALKAISKDIGIKNIRLD